MSKPAEELSKLIGSFLESGPSNDARAADARAVDASPAMPARSVSSKMEIVALILDSYPADKKIAVIQQIRAATGLGLAEAKHLSEQLPAKIPVDGSRRVVEALKSKFEDLGGVRVTLRTGDESDEDESEEEEDEEDEDDDDDEDEEDEESDEDEVSDEDEDDESESNESAERWSAPVAAGPSCPYCSKPLRSEKARQCFACGMDWHNPQNVIKR